MPKQNFDDFLRKELADTQVASEYLNAALEGGSSEEFLIALRNVAQAHGGIGELAELAKLNRQAMYKMLSEAGNPTLGNLLNLLKVIGIRITFTPARNKKAA
ncbi:MAG: transcriptional regulator [Candidatus Omnitrophica bacterium]|nr:transcriptional regulator [Candidatus Omnitrophota bacterium]